MAVKILTDTKEKISRSQVTNEAVKNALEHKFDELIKTKVSNESHKAIEIAKKIRKFEDEIAGNPNALVRSLNRKGGLFQMQPVK